VSVSERLATGFDQPCRIHNNASIKSYSDRIIQTGRIQLLSLSTASTIARIPRRIASGSVGQALIIAANSGSF